MFPIFKFIYLLIAIGLTSILLLLGITNRQNASGRFAIGLVVLFLIMIGSLAINHWWNSKTILDRNDYNGEYIIDRSYFKGDQADWQYNHYRFEVTKDDSIFFHVTNGRSIVKNLLWNRVER